MVKMHLPTTRYHLHAKLCTGGTRSNASTSATLLYSNALSSTIYTYYLYLMTHSLCIKSSCHSYKRRRLPEKRHRLSYPRLSFPWHKANVSLSALNAATAYSNDLSDEGSCFQKKEQSAGFVE